MCDLATFYCSTVYLIFNCYFIHVYIVTVTLICGICSSVISLCNCAISFVLLYCYIVTLVRLSLVTIKGYLLAYYIPLIQCGLLNCAIANDDDRPSRSFQVL